MFNIFIKLYYMEIVGTIKIYDRNGALVHILVGEREAMSIVSNDMANAVTTLSNGYTIEFTAVEPETEPVVIAKRILSKIASDIRNKE